MKKFLLLFVLSISFFAKTYASHVMGADLTYTCLGPNQYLVSLQVYRDCNGITLGGPLTIDISSAQCGVTTTLSLNQVGQPVDVTPVCFSGTSACSGGSGYGIQKYTFQGILNLPPGCGADWILSWSLCCRNAAITTLSDPGNESLYIEAHLNNTLASCDNSPSFTNDPIGIYCVNNIQFFNHGAIDADGDSLYFYLAPSLNGAGSSVAYAGSYNATNPLSSTGGTIIDPRTGQLGFIPSQTQVAVMKVAVDEFRNGVLIGHIERDMELIITNCTNNPPTSGGINGTTGANNHTYTTPACSNFCFTIQTSDPNASDSVKYSWVSSDLPGATITSSGGKTPLLTICWAPTQSDVGTHTFVLNLKDNACPYIGTSSVAYTVVVTPASNPPVSAGNDTTLCPGRSVNLTASSAGSVTSYTWSDGTNIHSGATWNVSPSVTTIYTVSAVYTNGCVLTDQVIVYRNPTPTVTAFPSISTICSTSDTVQVTATGTHVASFLWTPGGGLTCTTCASPKISPTSSTVYSVVAIDSFGCQSAPFNVTVNLAPPPPVQSCAVIYASPTGTGTGTQASPASLATALSKAQCNNALIKLAIGTYTIDNPITNLGSYTTLEGGFDPANNWRKTSTPGATTIYRSALNLEGTTAAEKRIVAFYLNGAKYFRLQDITIQTADCPSLAAGDYSGYSNYVMHMVNCSNYDFVRTQIIPGAATNGADGVTPAGSGGAATGGNGGAGGAGNPNTGCNKNGSAGSAGSAGSPGGAGGGGGAGATGNGCNTVGCGANAVGGSNGGNGTAGTVGTDASSTAPASPGTTTTFFQVAGQAASGTNGTAGGGGGGGGGGSKGTDCTCSINGTPNGGAGGNGGNGGLAGTGGYGGGGSFGIYLVNNGAGGKFTDCDIYQNAAGTGGAGGTGQLGTNGSAGSGGVSTTGSCGNVSGGTGGNGGNGGRGGNGQPGANGVSAAIISNGTVPTFVAHGASTAISTGVNNPPLFNLVLQNTIYCANISCTNRNDTLSAGSSGNWTAGTGATVPSGTGSTLVTQYTNVGRKDIGYSGDTYTGFVYIALDQSSFVPVIQSSAAVLSGDTFWVCKGSQANFSLQIASADTFDWNFGGATAPNTYYGANFQNLTNLTFNTAGTFRIISRIKTSCCGWSPYDTAYLVVEPNAAISYSGITNFCAGDSLNIILTGGTSYSWAPTAGVSNPTGSNVWIKPQVSTTYLVTSYSPRGLCNADTSIAINKNTPATLAFSSVSATCGPNGSITVTPTPAGAYTYSWNPSGSTATLSGKPAGTYSVTVTPVGSNCSVTGASSISAGAGLQAFFVRSVSPKCFGQCTGLVKVKALGGAAPYSYVWSNGTTGIDSLINRCAGSYSVTITDNSGCTASATQTLSQPIKLTVAVLDSTSTLCNNTCNGSAQVDGAGGSGPYTYVWNDPAGQVTSHPINLCPGHYSVTAVDQNLCTALGGVNIISPPALIADTLRVQNVSCFGGNNGQIILKVQGGVHPYRYTWTPNVSIDSMGLSLIARAYSVIVTDTNGCKDTVNATVTQPTRLSPSVILDSVSCFGGNDGGIIASSAGGTSPYTYAIDGSVSFQSSGTFTGLTAGPHTVTIRDAHSCDSIVSFNIYQPTALSASILYTRDASCNGACDGTIRAKGTGGTAPYKFSKDGVTFTSIDSFNALCAGAFTITVKDANGCTATVPATVNQPAVLALDTTSTKQPTCFGSADGRIVVSATGGTATYLYSIDLGPTQPSGTFNSIAAGPHTLTVKDAHNCTKSITVTLSQPPALIADTLSTKSVNCFGGNDGKITLVVNGGTRPYVYSWNPNVSIDSLGLNLTARPYSITVTDSHGCKDTVNTAINQPTRLSPSVILDSVSCFGGNDGGIIASSTGGTSPYTYAIDGSGTFQSSGTFTGLTAGPHTVTIRDAHSCDSIVSFNIYQPTALSASLIYTRDASCNGTCDGAIRAKGNGGTAPYIFSKDGVTFSSIDSFNALCAGGFTITVKDAKGCTATVPATINQPAVLALDTTSTKQPSCFGAIDGRIVVSATGGTASYLYSIDLGPTQATGTFNGLVAGNHTLTVKDAHNCTKSINVVLGQPALLVADTLSTKSVTCFGGNDGAIKLTVSGGTYPYTYGWTPNVSIDSLGNSLTARPYSILVTDLHGCTSTVNVTISQPTRLSPSIILDSVSCFGGNDGGVTASSTGGTSPYTYAIDGSGTFQSSGTFTGLNAGPHTVTIRDAHSCDSIVAFNIYQPTVLSASILYTRNTSCNGTCDGAIRAKGTGGTAPYTFSSDGVTFSAIDSFVGLCANSFTITVKDANGCTATAPATITQPSALVLDTVSTRPPTCYASSDGQIILTASGGTGSYQYAVDAGSYQASATFNGLSYGPHVGHVKDANGCIANFNVALTQPNPLIADTLSTQNISCFGGSDGVIILSVTGGHYPYTYSWPQIPGKTDSLGSTFAAGTYTPIVTDLTGCFDTVKVTLTQPTKLAPSYTMDSVSCFGAADASVTVTATGGTASYTYDLDAAGAPQASGTFSGLSAGPHTVTVTDAHGCDSIVRFTIYQPTALTTSNPAERDASCNGTCDGMMRGAGSGGTAPYTYSKDGVTFSSVDSFNALCAGNYTVTVKDAKGCTATVNVTVGQPTPLVLDTIGTNPPTCYNGTNGGFVMTASGGTAGYQFSADSGATYQASATFINQSVGPHRVQVKDAHGCITTFTFDVPNTPPSSTFDTVVTNVKCFGGSDGTITLVINGTATPYTFAWSNAATSQNLTGLAIGTYVPTVTDGNGCRVYALNGVNGVDSIKISQPTQIAETHTQTDVSCFGGSNGCITVTPSGGTPNAAAPLYSHSWSNGATTDNPCGLAVGTYTDTITDANGCRFTSAPITINQPSAISATDTFTPVSCPGTADGTATVSASGGTSPYSYLWSSGATGAQATNLTDTTYTVIITDAKGCKDTSSVTVSAINPMQLNAQKKNVFCVPLKNGMINLPVTSGKPPYTFIWDNGSTSPTLTQLGNGTYNVTITDANGCQRDTSFVVITDSSFILTVVPDTATINEGDQIQLASNTRGDGLSSILWSPELSLSCFDCLNPLATPYTTTEYSIHAVSDSGCIADAKSLITVIPQHQVYIPNAFTPNHDGPNDYWEIYGNKKVWVFVEAQVFDRWGEKIFESNDINFQWDGTYKGTPMEPGVYIYTCTIVFLDGKKIDNKGSITLIR